MMRLSHPIVRVFLSPRWANGTLATATPPTCPQGGASSPPSASGPTPQTSTPGHNKIQIQSLEPVFENTQICIHTWHIFDPCRLIPF